MGHDRSLPKKPDRKPKANKGKKHKGLPPHLQRSQNKDSIRDIQTYVDNAAKRQSDKGDSK